MKYKLVLVIFYLFLSGTTVFSQINFYDSVKIVASSDTYDFKNPVFSQGVQGFSNIVWLAYERYGSIGSDLIVRAAKYNIYETETILTTGINSLNINPHLNRNFLVWQSNVHGSWDIYFSAFTNNSYWSEPLLIDTSSADETMPNILNNNSSSGHYFLVYKKNNNICFKRYNAILSLWDKDTVLTSGTSEYSSPLLFEQNTSTGFSITYLKYESPGISKLYQRLFNESISGDLIWHEPLEVYQPGSQEYLTSSDGYVTYSYDTLGKKNVIGFQPGGGSLIEVFTKTIPGNHSFGKASTMGVLTENLYYWFSVIACLTKSSDSSQLTFINRPGTFNINPLYKKIYLGDTNVITKMDLSTPVFLSLGGLYRIKAVWEKVINGKTALVESYMTDIMGNVNSNNSTTEKYHLFQNYPNPFNPKTIINYQLAISNIVKLKVFNALGKEIVTLVNEKQNAGSYSVEFNGEDLPSGVYYYKLETDNFYSDK